MTISDIVTQRAFLRELIQQFEGDSDAIVREYANAERGGRITRRRKGGAASPEDYARHLLADGRRKGWLEGAVQVRRSRRVPRRDMKPIRVSIPLLLKFFDEPDEDCRGHASAIAAIAGEDLGAALFANFINASSGQAEILPNRCTQGTKKGVRLDRWILVTWDDGQQVLFQTEIKNWSAHAIGGRKLAVDATVQNGEEYRRERWGREWNDSGIIKKEVRKVITPMRPPLSGIRVEPLVCFWTSLHPSGSTSPFFRVALPDGPFPHLAVFSMSSYLRQLKGVSDIDLPMPDTRRRMALLGGMFSEIRDDEL